MKFLEVTEPTVVEPVCGLLPVAISELELQRITEDVIEPSNYLERLYKVGWLILSQRTCQSPYVFYSLGYLLRHLCAKSLFRLQEVYLVQGTGSPILLE